MTVVPSIIETILEKVGEEEEEEENLTLNNRTCPTWVVEKERRRRSTIQNPQKTQD